MLYYFVDPIIYAITATSGVSEPNEQHFEDFISQLLAWAQAARDSAAHFLISEDCIHALQSEPCDYHLYTDSFELQQLLIEWGVVWCSSEDVIQASNRFLNLPAIEHYFADYVASLSGADVEITSTDVKPDEFLDQHSPTLGKALRDALGKLAFLKNPKFRGGTRLIDLNGISIVSTKQIARNGLEVKVELAVLRNSSPHDLHRRTAETTFPLINDPVAVAQRGPEPLPPRIRIMVVGGPPSLEHETTDMAMRENLDLIWGPDSAAKIKRYKQRMRSVNGIVFVTANLEHKISVPLRDEAVRQKLPMIHVPNNQTGAETIFKYITQLASSIRALL